MWRNKFGPNHFDLVSMFLRMYIYYNMGRAKSLYVGCEIISGFILVDRSFNVRYMLLISIFYIIKVTAFSQIKV